MSDDNPLGDKIVFGLVVIVSILAACASLISLAVFLNWLVSR